jgi:hypothetical protein
VYSDGDVSGDSALLLRRWREVCYTLLYSFSLLNLLQLKVKNTLRKCSSAYALEVGSLLELCRQIAFPPPLPFLLISSGGSGGSGGSRGSGGSSSSSSGFSFLQPALLRPLVLALFLDLVEASAPFVRLLQRRRERGVLLSVPLIVFGI